jgi:hypothetical protein
LKDETRIMGQFKIVNIVLRRKQGFVDQYHRVTPCVRAMLAVQSDVHTATCALRLGVSAFTCPRDGPRDSPRCGDPRWWSVVRMPGPHAGGVRWRGLDSGKGEVRRS